MSSAVGSTSAALGRPFLFDDEAKAEVCSLPSANRAWQRQILQSTINHQKSTIPLTPASRLEIRPAPEMASSGIPDLDTLTGGLPRGCLTEIYGPASSGRTTMLLAALAAATRRGEFCALIDASDALDPHSVEAACVDLDRLLWVRCGEDMQNSRPIKLTVQSKKSGGAPPLSRTRPFEHCLEQVLRSTDLLLESGGFGLIILDLGDLPLQSARHIPLTTWFRFRRAVEHKPTILLAIEQHPIAGSCSSLLLQLGAPKFSGEPIQFAPSNFGREHPAHAHLFSGLGIQAELIRSRLDRNPRAPSHSQPKPPGRGETMTPIIQFPNYKITK